QRRPAIGDPVKIAAADAGEAGVEVLIDRLGREDRDRQRPQLGVGPVGEPVRSDRLLDIDMGGHRQRMDAGIGAPRGMESHLLMADRPDRLLDRLLDRRAVRLPLPAHERAAVIFDRETKARHASVAPAGMTKPRSSSAVVMAPRPARWTRLGRIDPPPQAMARPWSSTVPGAPLNPPISAASTLIRSPPYSK